MINEWFILIDGKQEGPYRLEELRAHPKITPDTFVWTKGWKDWKAIRYVPELKEVFKDKPTPKPVSGDGKKPVTVELKPDQSALTITQQDPFHPFLWLLLIFSLLIYLIYLLSR